MTIIRVEKAVGLKVIVAIERVCGGNAEGGGRGEACSRLGVFCGVRNGLAENCRDRGRPARPLELTRDYLRRRRAAMRAGREKYFR